MEPQTFGFEPETPVLSDETRQAMARTEAALKRMWERERIDGSMVYEIMIPSQELTVSGKDRAEHVLRTLKGLKVRGTYRITKK